MLPAKHVRLIGRTIKKAMKLRGGGSALPGLVVEKLDPDFLSRTLGTLSRGVIIVSGTNGKTTTTKMVAELLRSQGLKVFTNASGSNFTRGIAASLLDHLDESGKLEADIAVVELDEAHAIHFIKRVTPRYSLLLNVLRDQLDRYGEIDYTAGLLQKVVEATSEGIVLNRENDLIRALAASVPDSKKLQYFGVDETLRHYFPSDSELHDMSSGAQHKLPPLSARDVILKSYHKDIVTFSFGKRELAKMKLRTGSVYNAFNASAALAMVRMVVGDDQIDADKLAESLITIRPAFGRGEAVEIDGEPLEIILVKNPSGFKLALQSYVEQPADTMIIINDHYADGRDMSWLWDVDFTSLGKQTVSMVSGGRAYDMALRLQYDLVDVSKVETNLRLALDEFLKNSSGRRRIYCTYTAMLALRRELAKNYPVEAIE